MAMTSSAYVLSADAYHVAAGFLLKLGDYGLAHLATDRSMTAALASQDPLTVGASARIVTHTLMSSGHLPAAIVTARNHAVRLDRGIGRRHRSPCRCTGRCSCGGNLIDNYPWHLGLDEAERMLDPATQKP